MARGILAVASGGGHWLELHRMKLAFDGLDVAYVCVHDNYARQVCGHRFYTVRDATRWDRFGVVFLATQLIAVVCRERPRVVITTGAAPGLLAILIAKLLCGAKTIWIDSIANYETLSTSGKLARYFADVWLTQWPHLQSRSGPQYWGAVL